MYRNVRGAGIVFHKITYKKVLLNPCIVKLEDIWPKTYNGSSLKQYFAGLKIWTGGVMCESVRMSISSFLLFVYMNASISNMTQYVLVKFEDT